MTKLFHVRCAHRETGEPYIVPTTASSMAEAEAKVAQEHVVMPITNGLNGTTPGVDHASPAGPHAPDAPVFLRLSPADREWLAGWFDQLKPHPPAAYLPTSPLPVNITDRDTPRGRMSSSATISWGVAKGVILTLLLVFTIVVLLAMFTGALEAFQRFMSGSVRSL